MTRSELLEVVYRFYPRGVPSYEPAYDTTGGRARARPIRVEFGRSLVLQIGSAAWCAHRPSRSLRCSAACSV